MYKQGSSQQAGFPIPFQATPLSGGRTLSRRIVLGGVVGASLAAPALIKSAAASGGGIAVVYISAEDCAPCRAFEASDWPQWQASPLSQRVRFLRAHAPKTTQAYQTKYWPSEARSFAGAVKVPVVPSFILANNGGVVLVGSGLVGWRNQVLPEIRRISAAGGAQS